MNLSRAEEAFRGGQPFEAERMCRDLLHRSPQSWAAYPLLVDCLLAQGKVSAADELTADLLSRQPNEPDLLVARGLSLSRSGRLHEAVTFIDRAIDIRLDHQRGHEALATVLEMRNDPRPRYEVSVITPTIGTAFVRQAIESVQQQRYPLVRHFIVADGPECHDRVAEMVPTDPRHPIHVLPLPLNVGGGGFCGHRVYGAMPFLVPSRFVAFLDEDNWFADDHLETLMHAITSRGLAWAYSLRTIVSLEGEVITTDDCESLGEWPTWNNPDVHLVDVNCYVVRRDLAIAMSSLWHRRFRAEEGPDFALCRRLVAEQPRCATNGRYSLQYRVGRSPMSVRAEFFLRGNREMERKYGTTFPWRAASGV